MRYREIAPLFEDAPRIMSGDDEYQRHEVSDDSRSLDLDDTRKPKLTLKMINRLKKIRSTKSLEMAKNQELLGIMYGIPDESEDI